MILVVATICFLSDPVTLECKTEVVRVEPTPIACIKMLAPVETWLRETHSPEWVAVACKNGPLY